MVLDRYVEPGLFDLTNHVDDRYERMVYMTHYWDAYICEDCLDMVNPTSAARNFTIVKGDKKKRCKCFWCNKTKQTTKCRLGKNKISRNFMLTLFQKLWNRIENKKMLDDMNHGIFNKIPYRESGALWDIWTAEPYVSLRKNYNMI